MATLQEQLKALLLQAGAPQAQTPFGIPGSTPVQPPIQPDAPQEPAVLPPQPQAAIPSPGIGRAPSSGGGNPSLKELQSLLRSRIEDSENGQKDNIALQRAALAGQFAKKQEIDLSGGYATARMLGAKGAGEGYSAPGDVSKGDQAPLSALSKAQQSLTDDQVNQLKAELQNKLMQNSLSNQRMGIMQDRLHEQVYGKAVAAVKNDKILADLIGKNNNITRTTDVLFAPGQKISTSSLHDLQQTVTGALTSLTSGGGVGERDKRYIETLQNKMQHLEQTMGDLDSIPRDDPTLQHFMALAQEGQSYIQAQAKQRLKTVGIGHENITNLPTYKPMYNSVMQEMEGTMMKPKYFTDPVNDTAALIKKGNEANAQPHVMDQDTFIQNYLKAKKAQNGK